MNFDVPGVGNDECAPPARRLGDLVATSTFRAGSPTELFRVLDECLTAAGAYREQLVRVDVELSSADQRAELDEAWLAWMPHPESRPTRTVRVALDAEAGLAASALAWSPQSL